MTRERLNELNLDHLTKYLTENLVKDFTANAGIEHYRMLNDICKGKDLVYDIGTYRGSSSVAMSSAKKVVSYDVEDFKTVKKLKNVTYKIGEAMDDENILDADLILLDTYHTGTYEAAFYDFLRRNNYKGILLCDDIKLNNDMKFFWKSIINHKEDFTKFGHYTGTGLVDFSKRVKRCKSCG